MQAEIALHLNNHPTVADASVRMWKILIDLLSELTWAVFQATRVSQLPETVLRLQIKL